MSTEIVWDGHDNSIDFILKADGSAVDLSATTKITASFGKKRLESVAPSSGIIRWSSSLGYDTGEVRMFLGQSCVLPGIYDVPIITYATAGSSNGLVWGNLRIKVISDIEATAT